tara:strand:+ start:41 stop:259 length:219 start_codon:yes stop_codon:yes gene_type:complete
MKNLKNTKENIIKEGYQRLFKSAWTTYINKVALANDCSVNQIVKISNALPNVRKELQDNFLKIINKGEKNEI